MHQKALQRTRRASSSSSLSQEPPLTVVGGDEQMLSSAKAVAVPSARHVLVRGFACAMARHAFNFHVITASRPGTWMTVPLPGILTEKSGCYSFHDSVSWQCDDRNVPTADCGDLIANFVAACMDAFQLSDELLVFALVLIERFARSVGLDRGPIRLHTIRPIVFSTFSTASKLRQGPAVSPRLDRVMCADVRAEAALVNCEATLLKHIGHNLVVDRQTFSTYYVAMRDLYEREALAASAAEDADEESDVFSDDDTSDELDAGDAMSHCTTE